MISSLVEDHPAKTIHELRVPGHDACAVRSVGITADNGPFMVLIGYQIVQSGKHGLERAPDIRVVPRNQVDRAGSRLSGNRLRILEKRHADHHVSQAADVCRIAARASGPSIEPQHHRIPAKRIEVLGNLNKQLGASASQRLRQIGKRNAIHAPRQQLPGRKRSTQQ